MSGSSNNVSTGLILIVLVSVFIMLTKNKIFYGYIANLYYGKCIFLYKNEDLCKQDREFILSLSKHDKVIELGANSQEEEDKKEKAVLEEVKQKIIKEVFPIHAILIAVEGFIVFGIYSGLFNKKTSSKKQKKSKDVPKELLEIFPNPEMKKAVYNFYEFAEISKKDIEKLRKMKESGVGDEVLFAGFMLLARKTINFSAGQVAKDIKDEFIRGIIFVSGRPSVPFDYEDYFEVAGSLLSSFENPQN